MPLTTVDPTPALAKAFRRHSLERVFPKFGETAASAEIINLLDRAAGRPDLAAAGPSQTHR